MKRFVWLVLAVSLPLLAVGSLSAQVGQTTGGGMGSGAGSGSAASENLVPGSAPSASELIVADFDTGDKPNNIGGDFGSWDKDPNDETQLCQMSFESDDALGDKLGYSIRLDYDVDSPNPAYNGFWMKLNGLDATAYNTVNFYIKGDAVAGFTKRLKIELKDSTKQPSPYILSGLTDQWQKFSIPFEKFRRVKNWDQMNEFVVVFDDINSNPKSGTLFVDHVTFSTE
ncbi:MAG TPA: hypothetical protein VJA00_02690 [Candidatus Omnitrophota bacterium]|nr:hypothetical protein [Candidatus Omnitrophota bacterium]